MYCCKKKCQYLMLTPTVPSIVTQQYLVVWKDSMSTLCPFDAGLLSACCQLVVLDYLYLSFGIGGSDVLQYQWKQETQSPNIRHATLFSPMHSHSSHLLPSDLHCFFQENILVNKVQECKVNGAYQNSPQHKKHIQEEEMKE